MKRWLIAVVLTTTQIASACTTLKPVAASPEEVQRQLLTEHLVRPGDRVRLVTVDEVVHKFKVTALDFDRGLVIGRNNSVVITDVVAAETSKVSVGRTSLLVGGVGIGIAALVAIAVAPAILLGGG